MDELRNVYIDDGPECASEVVSGLFVTEFKQLEWLPLDGARFALACVSLAIPTLTLLSSVCVYLSMYFQELDEDISRCRELIEEGSIDSLLQARRLLMASILRLDGLVDL
ncbi:hypothetical protein DV096_00850 [Bradymonadaceae bacterium TMQ3]|nr:hypothetical protein DV096_00850 [Bradymonadaceae bacterium TMQ3]